MRTTNAIIGFACLMLIAACQGQVQGVVYLDGNGNGVMEPEEQPFAQLLVKATDERNELVGTTRTGGNGKFGIAIPGPGQYCVEVDSGAFDPAAGLSVPMVVKGAGDATPAGAPPDASVGVVAPTATRTLCGRATVYSVEINVPVVRDYAAALGRLPPVSKQTYAPGETFAITLPNPPECELTPLYLPDTLRLGHTLVPQMLGIDVALNAVTFLPEARANGVAEPMTPETGLVARTLQLRVRDEVPPGEFDVTLHPKTVCPGGREFALPEIAFAVKSAPQVSATLSLGAAPALGGELPLTVEVRNRAAVAQRDVLLLVTLPGAMRITAVDAECHNLGSKAECRFDLGKRTTLRRTITALLPDRLLQSPTQFTIEAHVTVPGVEEPVPVEPVVFTLER